MTALTVNHTSNAPQETHSIKSASGTPAVASTNPRTKILSDIRKRSTSSINQNSNWFNLRETLKDLNKVN